MKRRTLSTSRDPFADRDRAVMEEMKRGFSDILQLHNAIEVSSLAGALGLNPEGTVDEIRANISTHLASREESQGLVHTEKKYNETLKLIWEGILFEYLRMVGQPLYSYNLDPRTFVVQYWRKRIIEAENRLFVPYYMQKQAHSMLLTEESVEDDVKAIIQDVEEKELRVKFFEKIIRGDHDHRHVLSFLAAMKDLREAERKHREYLIGRLRSEFDHYVRSRKAVERQREEAELRLQEGELAFAQRMEAMSKSLQILWDFLVQKLLSHAALGQDILRFTNGTVEFPPLESIPDQDSPDASSAGGADASGSSASRLRQELADLADSDSDKSGTEDVASDSLSDSDAWVNDAFANALCKFDTEIQERNRAILRQNRHILSLQEALEESNRALEQERQRADSSEMELRHFREYRRQAEDIVSDLLSARVLNDVLNEQLSAAHAKDTETIDALRERIRTSRATIDALVISSTEESRALGWNLVSSLELARGEELSQMQENAAMHFEELLRRKASEREGRRKSRKIAKGKKGAKVSKSKSAQANDENAATKDSKSPKSTKGPKSPKGAKTPKTPKSPKSAKSPKSRTPKDAPSTKNRPRKAEI